MPNTLTKPDIVEAIQKENGYSLKQSVEVTEILMEIIKQSLESGEDVLISGFGKFQQLQVGDVRVGNVRAERSQI